LKIALPHPNERIANVRTTAGPYICAGGWRRHEGGGVRLYVGRLGHKLESKPGDPNTCSPSLARATASIQTSKNVSSDERY
jgi:hypothetical protein